MSCVLQWEHSLAGSRRPRKDCQLNEVLRPRSGQEEASEWKAEKQCIGSSGHALAQCACGDAIRRHDIEHHCEGVACEKTGSGAFRSARNAAAVLHTRMTTKTDHEDTANAACRRGATRNEGHPCASAGTAGGLTALGRPATIDILLYGPLFLIKEQLTCDRGPAPQTLRLEKTADGKH